MINANAYPGKTDSETLENALQNLQADGILLIPPRVSEVEPERDYWLIDRAILLSENTTVILQNSTIKLSDRCRDNFFRSANCGFGFPDPAPMRNIHIRGEGFCTLQGAEHPRASGDSSKRQHNPCPHTPEDLCRIRPDWVPEELLSPDKIRCFDIHAHSYGTDAGKAEESQYGDWRGIGILFANVEHFSIENLHIVESHGWGISLEACANGRIEKIDFDARMSKEIDGMRMNMENQDGIDIRNGCHHIVITNITGETGDDLIALTACIPDEATYLPGGSLRTTHVMHNDWTRREKNIHDIIIRNVIGRSYLCWVLRLLPANTEIYNVIIDGIVDTAPTDNRPSGTILLGDAGVYGTNQPDSMHGITISNVVCNSQAAVTVAGFLRDSVISNVVNLNPDCTALRVDRPTGLNNVLTTNLLNTQN